ncbi:MAG: aminotransferase class IV [Terriglobia bacterium]
MTDFVYINGEYVDAAEARVAATEPGLLFGFGLFETVRAYGGQLFRPEEHWQRLYRGAEALGLAPGLEPPALTATCHKLLVKSGQLDSAVRVSVYKGSDTDILVIHLRSDWHYPSELYRVGAHVAVGRHRLNHKTPTAPLKTTSRLLNALTDAEAKKVGALEGLLLNVDGEVAEGSRSNIFWGEGDVLSTPPLSTGCLAGVTRRIVLGLAETKGIRVNEKVTDADGLKRADEAFLSSTLLEVMPIQKIDGTPVRGACPGRLTMILRQAFRELVIDEMGGPSAG